MCRWSWKQHIASCSIPKQIESELWEFFKSTSDVIYCWSPTIFVSFQNSYCGHPIAIGTTTIITQWINKTSRFQEPHSEIVFRGCGDWVQVSSVTQILNNSNASSKWTREHNRSIYLSLWSPSAPEPCEAWAHQMCSMFHQWTCDCCSQGSSFRMQAAEAVEENDCREAAPQLSAPAPSP